MNNDKKGICATFQESVDLEIKIFFKFFVYLLIHIFFLVYDVTLICKLFDQIQVVAQPIQVLN